MKHIILYLLITVFSMSLYAQETSLTINVTPGKLKDAMTEEQMKTVTTLALTGEMDNSDFYVIRDHMKSLEVLDLGKVVADTIPSGGLGLYQMTRIVLPAHLTIIQETAFFNCQKLATVVWSDFPQKIEDFSFITCKSLVNFEVVSGSNNCISIDSVLFSADRKSLLCYPAMKGENYQIPDGTEIIAHDAFVDARLFKITIPESVKKIGKKAFHVGYVSATNGGDGAALSEVNCKNPFPIILEEDPFIFKHHTELSVPIGSEELYKKAPIWNGFAKINGETIDPAQSMQEELDSQVKTYFSNNNLHIKSEKIINIIDILDTNGNTLYHKKLLAREHSLSEKIFIGVCVIKVVYQDGSKDVIKIIK